MNIGHGIKVERGGGSGGLQRVSANPDPPRALFVYRFISIRRALVSAARSAAACIKTSARLTVI